jgi:hypothetical protein
VAIIRRSGTVNVGQAPQTSLADNMDFDGSGAGQKTDETLWQTAFSTASFVEMLEAVS